MRRKLPEDALRLGSKRERVGLDETARFFENPFHCEMQHPFQELPRSGTLEIPAGVGIAGGIADL